MKYECFKIPNGIVLYMSITRVYHKSMQFEREVWQGWGLVFVLAMVAAATVAVGLMVGVAAVDWPMVAGFTCNQLIFCSSVAKLG